MHLDAWLGSLIAALVAGGISAMANRNTNAFYYGKTVERLDGLGEKLAEHIQVEHRRIDDRFETLGKEQDRQWRDIGEQGKMLEFVRGRLNGKAAGTQ